MNFKLAQIDLREGIRSKYPPCCVLQFYLDRLMGNEDNVIFRHVKGKQYALCSLHMRAYHRKEGLTKEVLDFLENDCRMQFEDIINLYLNRK